MEAEKEGILRIGFPSKGAHQGHEAALGKGVAIEAGKAGGKGGVRSKGTALRVEGQPGERCGERRLGRASAFAEVARLREKAGGVGKGEKPLLKRSKRRPRERCHPGDRDCRPREERGPAQDEEGHEPPRPNLPQGRGGEEERAKKKPQRRGGTRIACVALTALRARALDAAGPRRRPGPRAGMTRSTGRSARVGTRKLRRAEPAPAVDRRRAGRSTRTARRGWRSRPVRPRSRGRAAERARAAAGEDPRERCSRGAGSPAGRGAETSPRAGWSANHPRLPSGRCRCSTAPPSSRRASGPKACATMGA